MLHRHEEAREFDLYRNHDMKTKLLLLLISAAAFGFATFEDTEYWITRNARLHAPGALDLGHQEAGARVAASFKIRNDGRQSLVLDHFETSCGCLSVGLKEKDAVAPVATLPVEPGEERELVANIAIRGAPGTQLRETVSFQTNDPEHSSHRLELKASVHGSLIVVPDRVCVGRIVIGEPVHRHIEIRDGGSRQGLALSEVRITRPDVIRVGTITKLPNADPASGQDAAPRRDSYRVELHIRAPKEPGRIDAFVEVYLEGEDTAASRVMITGEAVAELEFSPPSLVIPRTSDKGPIYTATTMLRSNRNEEFDLMSADVPDAFSVQIEPKGKGVSAVKVTYRGPLPPKALSYKLRFTVKRGIRSDNLEVPVALWQPPSS